VASHDVCFFLNGYVELSLLIFWYLILRFAFHMRFFFFTLWGSDSMLQDPNIEDAPGRIIDYISHIFRAINSPLGWNRCGFKFFEDFSKSFRLLKKLKTATKNLRKVFEKFKTATVSAQGGIYCAENMRNIVYYPTWRVFNIWVLQHGVRPSKCKKKKAHVKGKAQYQVSKNQKG
jgi:hypothetical protein